MNHIIIRRKHGRYFACYEGPHARTVRNIFGTAEIPTAYLAETSAQYVLKNMQRSDCRVVLSASLQLEAK